MTVRRFWAGINRLSGEFPGARLAIATHSGCIRAFAVSALGYDPGEPYNTEHVRVKLLGDNDWTHGGRDATVAYRNRVQEVKVPDIDLLPTWTVHDTGVACPTIPHTSLPRALHEMCEACPIIDWATRTAHDSVPSPQERWLLT